MFDTTLTTIGGTVWLAMAGPALWAGGPTERLATGALLIGWLITLSAHVVVDPLDRASVSPIIMTADAFQLVLFLVLARDLSRTWMAAAAACLAAIVLTQVISWLDPDVLSIGYLVTQSALSFGVMICLVYGALRVRAFKTAA